MLTGIGSTLLLPETKGRTLEELSNENQEGFVTGISGITVFVNQSFDIAFQASQERLKFKMVSLWLDTSSDIVFFSS